MARTRPIELKLAAQPRESAVLREALADRSASVVAQAARLCGDLGDRSLVADLRGAFERLLVDPVKRDPACRGKLAVLKALHLMEEFDPELSLQALRYRQLEPVFGGREDTAGELRGLGAVGLARSRAPEAAACLVELLVDPDPSARLSGVRALAYLDAGLALRLKALVGDSHPEVVSECLEGLLAIEGAGSVPFVARFLAAPESFEGAALALGGSRLSQALAPLREAWRTSSARADKRVLLLALALLRASDVLLELLRDEDWVAEALAGLESGLLEPVVEVAVRRPL